MQFINTILALATLTSATNMVHFFNQDSTSRNLVFTSEADLNLPPMPILTIPGLSAANVTFADNFIGNFYSFSNGSDNVPGMLGELRFQGYKGLTFFDVSSIVNAGDKDGVKQLYPLGMNITEPTTPVSGCNTMTKCLTQYNAPDDIATQATLETHLVCLLGNANTTDTDPTPTRRRHASARRNVELYPRMYVTGEEHMELE